MFRIILKIALVAGAAYWVMTGNRSVEMVAFYGVAIVLAGYDLTMGQGFPYRRKSIGDPPSFKKEASFAEKFLDGILILILIALGVYMVKFQ